MLLFPHKCIRQEESKALWESSGLRQMTLHVEKTRHLKQQRSCLWCDESPFGLITKIDAVYEGKKNKHPNAAEGKADFGRPTCQPLSSSFTFPLEKPDCLDPVPQWSCGSSQRRHEALELQPAMINNQPQNMSGFDLFLQVDVGTCWSNPSDGCES